LKENDLKDSEKAFTKEANLKGADISKAANLVELYQKFAPP